MRMGWLKFAILGSTYARALQNRAERTHGAGNVDPSLFSSMAAQPKAHFDTDLSSYARQSGALPPTAQSRAMTDLAHHIPWAGEEHTTDALSAKAPARFDRLLQQRGLVQHSAPGPNISQRIEAEFGQPRDREAWKAQQTTGLSGPRGESTAVLPQTPRAGEATAVLPGGAPSLQGKLPPPLSGHAPSMSDPISAVRPAPAANPPRQFARAKFQMGKVASLGVMAAMAATARR